MLSVVPLSATEVGEYKDCIWKRLVSLIELRLKVPLKDWIWSKTTGTCIYAHTHTHKEIHIIVVTIFF